MANDACSDRFAVRVLTEVKNRPEAVRQIDAIFFGNAAEAPAQTDRDAFRERWLGRYLARWPEWCFAACDEQGAVPGYLAGCPENPHLSDAFSDHRYYNLFADQCVRYPAHLHVNVAEDARGLGIGAALIDALSGKCRDASIRGLHAVTAYGDPNNSFFEACGMTPEAVADWNGRQLVFYALAL